MSELLLDAAGRRRSPATLPEFHAGRPPRNKGIRYPADPPTIEEIVDGHAPRRRQRPRPPAARPDRRAVARRPADPRGARARRGRPGRAPRFAAGAARQGRPPPRGRHGRLGVGAARALAPGARVELPVGPLFCVVNGATRGRPWAAAAARSELRRVAREAGVRRRFAPHQLRHAHAVEMAREGVPLIVIQRQLGHTNLGITSIYLQGIDNTEIIDTVHARRAPMVPVHSSLRV